MRRVLIIVVLAILLGSCSAIPLDFFGGATQQPPTVVCPTCQPTEECPVLPTDATQPPTATEMLTSTELPATPEVTATLEPTATPEPATPTETVVFTATPLPFTPTSIAFPLEMQSGSPIYTQNFAHPNEACNWMGVAGQVLDKNGLPQKNYVVVLTGKYDNQAIDLVSLTGVASSYGPGGYELALGSKLLVENELYLTVYNLAGEAYSNTVQLVTHADCKKNLIVVNFIMK